MFPKKARSGSRTHGLLSYLYGPGKHEEHTNPHLIGAWDAGVLDPARSSEMTLRDLAFLLEAPVHGLDGKRPAQHVYHVPVRNHQSDRILTDAEWYTVAREMMHAAGIAKHGDPFGCRWVAIRHADDHIHIVATLARQDGRAPDIRGDITNMQERARQFEREWGLARRVGGRDKTASRWPTQGELAKARRLDRAEAPRVTLQRTVREAAAAARSDDDFFARLTRAGVRVNRRTGQDGAITGYSVALPGDRTAAGRAVWYSGSRLAPDLSLPRVRERWAGPGADTTMAPTSRAEAWRTAAIHVGRATQILAHAGDAEGAGDVAALGDLLATYAAHAPRYVRDELRAAATAYERAGRAPAARRLDGEARELLQSATQSLTLAAMTGASGGEAAAAIALLSALALAVLAAHRWHQARQHEAQAAAARDASAYLRAATEVARGATSGGQEGQRRPVHGRDDQRAPARPDAATRRLETVRTALPERADEITSDDAWPALAATLDAAEDAGYEPADVLRAVATQRELGTADSVAQVLTWRLQGRMRRDSGESRADATTSARSTATAGGQQAGRDRPTHRRPPQQPPARDPRQGPRR